MSKLYIVSVYHDVIVLSDSEEGAKELALDDLKRNGVQGNIYAYEVGVKSSRITLAQLQKPPIGAESNKTALRVFLDLQNEQ